MRFFSDLFLVAAALLHPPLVIGGMGLAMAEVVDHSASLLSYKRTLALWQEGKAEKKKEICESFRTLGETENFRLRDLARLRSYLACPKISDEVDWSAFDEAYMEPLRAEAQLSVFEKQKKWDEYFPLLFETIPSMKQVKDRIAAAEKALELSRRHKKRKERKKFEELLYQLAPRKRPVVPASEAFNVGQDLILAREFAKGRVHLNKVIKDGRRPFEIRRKAYALYRGSFKVQGNRTRHIKEASKYYRWLMRHKQWAHAYDAGLYLARAQWTDSQKTLAKKTLAELEKNLGRRVKTYEIDFLRGRMANEDGNLEKSLVFYNSALEKGGRRSSSHYKIQYVKAWSLYQQGKLGEAADEFAVAYEVASEQPDQVRARYWQARALRKSGMEEEAVKTFREVTKEDPLGFYGLISYRDLNEKIPALDTAKAGASAVVEGEILTGDLRQLISDLAFVGEREALENQLNDLTLKHKWDWESAEGIELLRSYAKTGLYLPLFSILTKLPKEQREMLLLSHPELLFPNDYSELIVQAAKKESLSPELLFSIIRQESAFDPWARSPADAFGLMQVIPRAAKRAAQSLEMKFNGYEALYHPEINIPIGAHLLKKNMEKYENNLILAIASYNANDRAIRGWLRTRFRDDPLEFIEEIPYEETRAYVKLVLRNYVFYKRLSNPSQSMTFPSECLTSLHNFKTSTGKDVVSQ